MNSFVVSLQTELSKHFETVRVSSMQTQDQLLQEIRAINPDKLPGIIIVFDNMQLLSSEGIQELRFTLIAVAKFTASSSEKALAAFSCVDKLLEIFPADGRMIGEMFVHPTDCVAASPAANYAAFALGITSKKGF